MLILTVVAVLLMTPGFIVDLRDLRNPRSSEMPVKVRITVVGVGGSRCIREVAEQPGVRVFAKPRLADVININGSGQKRATTSATR